MQSANTRESEANVKTVISQCCEHKRIISVKYSLILIDSDDDDAEPR